ncbi:MAG: ECF transporter S component, partial [Candidatus Bathyarchaeum sp.]
DMLSGYLVFAPATFVIKGLEGFLAGFIADKKSLYRDVLAVVIAGSVMVTGYFIAEIFLLGMGQAIAEILPNIAQVSVGGLVGVPVALILRRRLPELFKD